MSTTDFRPFTAFLDEYKGRQKEKRDWSEETVAAFKLIHGYDESDLEQLLSPSESGLDPACVHAPLTKARLLRTVERLKEQPGPSSDYEKIFREILTVPLQSLKRPPDDRIPGEREQLLRWLTNNILNGTYSDVLWDIHRECDVDDDRDFFLGVSALASWANRNRSEDDISSCGDTSRLLTLDRLKESLKIGKDEVTGAGRTVLRLLVQFHDTRTASALLKVWDKTADIVAGWKDETTITTAWKGFWNNPWMGGVSDAWKQEEWLPVDWPSVKPEEADSHLPGINSVLQGMERICPPPRDMKKAVDSLSDRCFRDWLEHVGKVKRRLFDPDHFDRAWAAYADEREDSKSGDVRDKFDKAFVLRACLIGYTLDALGDPSFGGIRSRLIQKGAKPVVGIEDDRDPRDKAFTLLVDLMHRGNVIDPAQSIRSVLPQDPSIEKLREIKAFWEKAWGKRWWQGASGDEEHGRKEGPPPPPEWVSELNQEPKDNVGVEKRASTEHVSHRQPHRPVKDKDKNSEWVPVIAILAALSVAAVILVLINFFLG